jgi:hypothetical protein
VLRSVYVWDAAMYGANESPGVLRPVYSSVLILMICICALVGGLVVPPDVYVLS